MTNSAAEAWNERMKGANRILARSNVKRPIPGDVLVDDGASLEKESLFVKDSPGCLPANEESE